MLFNDVIDAINLAKNAIVSALKSIENVLRPPKLQTWTVRFPVGKPHEWKPPPGTMACIEQVSIDITDGQYDVVFEVDGHRLTFNAHAFRHWFVDLDLSVVHGDMPLYVTVQYKSEGAAVPIRIESHASLVLRGRLLTSSFSTSRPL